MKHGQLSAMRCGGMPAAVPDEIEENPLALRGCIDKGRRRSKNPNENSQARLAPVPSKGLLLDLIFHAAYKDAVKKREIPMETL
jgi:hypothetical protein